MTSQPIAPVVPEQYVVRVSDVYKRHAGVVALNGANLEARRGELTVISGHSGSGKSSLLSIVAGIDTPDSGSIKILGRQINGMSDAQLTKFKQGRVGLGFQSALTSRSFTLRENMKNAANSIGRKMDNSRMARLALEFGLADKLMQEVGGFSGGENIRAGLACGVANETELLLLDEVTSQLDHKSEENVLKWVRKTVDLTGTSVLLVTHQPEIASEYADREFVMRQGVVEDMIIHSRSAAAADAFTPAPVNLMPPMYGQA